MKTLYVYALVDPFDNLIKYVGCSKQPKKRLYEHWTQFHDWGGKAEWMRGLKKKGIKPRLFVLASYPDDEAKWQEREWFYFLLSQGMPMLNDPAKLYGGMIKAAESGRELPFEKGTAVFSWRESYRARVHRQVVLCNSR